MERTLKCLYEPECIVPGVLNIMYYSIVSLILVYVTAMVFFGYQLSGSWFRFIGAYFLVMLSMFSIGLMVGGVASNIKIASSDSGYHNDYVCGDLYQYFDSFLQNGSKQCFYRKLMIVDIKNHH